MDVRARTRLMAAEKDVLGYYCIARHLLNSNFKHPKVTGSDGLRKPIDAREFLKHAIVETTNVKLGRSALSAVTYMVTRNLVDPAAPTDIEPLVLHPKHRPRYLEYKESIAHVRAKLAEWGPSSPSRRKVHTLQTKYTPRDIPTLMVSAETQLHIERIAFHYVVLQRAVDITGLTLMAPHRVPVGRNKADELDFGDFILHVKSL